MRRERDGVEFYRSARSTLGARVKKKLTEKSSWYKKKRKREEEDVDEENIEKGSSPRKRKRGEETERKDASGEYPAKVTTDAKLTEETENMSAVAVIVVPYTKGAELAKRIRRYEMIAKEQTGWYLKVVEKAGDNLIDLLHRSNPWSGQDCQRDLCLHCQTKAKTGKYKTQDCTKRNCIYETWCMNCQGEEEKRIQEESGGDEKKSKEMMKRMKLYKYIGETSRSVYERSWEHVHSMEQLHTNSHMLKHALEKQGEEEDLGKIQFGVKVVRYTRSSFVRQVTESVIIQEERNHNILNSKSEYNRCSLPRLTANLGDREWKKRAKE